MRMNMSDFATFFAVARNQSFRAAGDELGLSSSAISHSIKTLEQRLKIRLFNRTTRSVSLTEAGSNLYERLRPAFDEIQIMLDEMNDFRLTPTGTLKINAARVAARIFLMSLLVGFTREYPDIKVELTTDDSLVDIVQQGFDAGVRLSCIVEKDMISVAIGPPVKLCVAATPEYFARYGKPRHPHDLLNHQLVAMNQALLLSYTVGSLLGPSFTAMLMQNFSDNLLFIMIASVSFIYLLMLLRNAGHTPKPVAHV